MQLTQNGQPAGPCSAIMPAMRTADAATYCGLAPATMEGLRCRGGGPLFIKYGRKAVRYRVQDLDRWMEERAVASTSEWR